MEDGVASASSRRGKESSRYSRLFRDPTCADLQDTFSRGIGKHRAGPQEHYFANNFSDLLMTARNALSLELTSFVLQNSASRLPSA